MRKWTIRVPVQHLSLTAMQEVGWDLSDGGWQEQEYLSRLVKEGLLTMLTRRQIQVARCLNDMEMTRRETASHLGVSLQAIHQIVLRMRKRLRQKGGI